MKEFLGTGHNKPTTNNTPKYTNSKKNEITPQGFLYNWVYHNV
jgi:hypothetical protein